MSHLVISGTNQQFSMNVLAFSSPIYETIFSTQTRTKAVHFPIRMTQPDVHFDVIFSSEKKFETFWKFVRSHQQQTLNNTRLVTLNWPARNIVNWSGMIKQFQAGGARRNYAPRASFQVDLVDSMVSSRTDFASVAAPWQSIYGGFGMGPDAVLSPPSSADMNLFGGGQSSPMSIGTGSVPYWWPE